MIRKHDIYTAYCKACKSKFSISYQGARDIIRHIQGKEQMKYSDSLASCSKVTHYFVESEDYSVIKSEVVFTSFLIEHNTPLAAADHAGPLFRAMFPDSKIVQKYGCSRTKTTAILNEALSRNLTENVISSVITNPSSFAIDGSSDRDDVKMYPLVVCRSNASVNISKHNSLKQKLELKHQNIYTLGCSCHNTAIEGAKGLRGVTGYDVADMAVDVYYYFEYSSGRKSMLKEISEFCDVEYRKVIKYGPTRWLSSEQVINRILLQYAALRSYFAAYLLFYQSVLPLFSEFNLTLQRETQRLFTLYTKGSVHFRVRKLLNRFVPLQYTCIDEATLLRDVDFKSFQLEDSKLYIGFSTKQKINELQSVVEPSQIAKFYQGVREFFTKPSSYMYKKFPWEDLVLSHAKFVDWEQRKVAALVLILPHSNADCERVFSIVTKNKTKFRSCMSVDTTLLSLLKCKINRFDEQPCFKFQPSKSLLKRPNQQQKTL